ncbi:hypothetical protein HAV15_010610 [Penicillium sp. str. |nr:hypothetical protein HAV15_010610 [Penicillium sp. str. \
MGSIEDALYGLVRTMQLMVSGKVIVPWPGTVPDYYKATEIIRWEDFGLVYENPGDQFASFGNGVTADGFVPNRFPWLHPPSDFQNRERTPI